LAETPKRDKYYITSYIRVRLSGAPLGKGGQFVGAGKVAAADDTHESNLNNPYGKEIEGN